MTIDKIIVALAAVYLAHAVVKNMKAARQGSTYYAGQIPAGFVWDETQGAYAKRDADGQLLALA